MIRYYLRRGRTATAERRRTAQRLTRKGWRRCTQAEYCRQRRARDVARLRELEEEDKERSVGGLC